MTPREELVVLVDDEGRPQGTIARTTAHGNPDLVHATVHVMVRTSAGEYVLQKRSREKDIAPGLWDTSVGGHLLPGENPEEGARREMGEELGIPAEQELAFAGTYVFRGEEESEYVTSFSCIWDGPFSPDPSEVEEIRTFTREEIAGLVGRGAFTPHFEREMEAIWSGAT